MKTKELTRPLLDSAPADDTSTSTSPNGNYGNNSIVKIMEKESHVFVVNHVINRLKSDCGKPIESNPFTVGSKGYSFTILLYPLGADRKAKCVSLFIKNHSGKTAHVVLGLIIQSFASFDPLNCGHSSFDDRETYHQVASMEPDQLHGTVDFTSFHFFMNLLPHDSIKIRATIGLVSDHDHDHDHDHDQPSPPPLSSSLGYDRQRCILFKVGDRHYYAQESVITTRCPPLLSDYPQSDHIFLISDVDSRVFEAVLWFLHHNNMLHENDRKAIANPNDDSFALKILAAADKFGLKDLTRKCQSFLYYGDSEVLDAYYEAESNVKEFWGNVSRLPKKMKELIPQKMKAA